MKNILTLFVCSFIFLIPPSYGQDSGDQIFSNEILHEVRINFVETDYWQILLDNFETTPDGQRVPYLQGMVMIDGEVVDSVGVRFKGFTSYQTDTKKPIKLDFNEFVPGKRYDGLRKLNLNNSTGDPGMQRDFICYELMRNMGVKAPRVSFSRVYFNDVYWGVYQNVEQVDKEFLQNNFTNDDGNLFKNKGWSHFEWNGPNHQSYHPPFEIKTNTDNPDWSGFVNLMDVLNNLPEEDYEKELEKIFNVDLFLKTLAVDVATNNWDSYLEHGRNWYIYEDLKTDLFHWIPWDYNFALSGQLGGGGDPGDCFAFADFITLPNTSTEIAFYDDSFSTDPIQTYVWDFGDGNTSSDINPVHNYATPGFYQVCLDVIVDNSCGNQLCKTIDTSDSPADCPVIQNGSCPHPPDVVFAQVLNVFSDCCDQWGVDCEEIHDWLSGNGGGFGSSDFTIDQRDNDGVLIGKTLFFEDFNERYYTEFCHLLDNVMLEDTMFNLIDRNKDLISQAVEDDPNFLFSYDDFLTDISHNDISEGIKGILTTRIMDLSLELDSIFTCPDEEAFVNSGDVVLNEFMASNDSLSGIIDMAGENDDWIELHNTTGATINLSGIYLSNDDTDLKKWEIPYGTRIRPDGYLIIWADEDDSQFGLHADFKLPKAGGSIILSNEDGSIIDQTSYTEQTTNIPSARIPNGTGPFVMQAATFNFNNEETSAVKKTEYALEARVFPNPTTNLINVEIDATTDQFLARIFSANGQQVLTKKLNTAKGQLDLSNLSNGIYLLQLNDIEGATHREKIMVFK